MIVDSKKFKELRIEAGISQRDMESATGVSRGTISKIETGKDNDIEEKTLKKLAKALKVKVEALIEGGKSEPKAEPETEAETEAKAEVVQPAEKQQQVARQSVARQLQKKSAKRRLGVVG